MICRIVKKIVPTLRYVLFQIPLSLPFCGIHGIVCHYILNEIESQDLVVLYNFLLLIL